MKRAKGLILAAVTMSLLTGCGGFSPDETAVSVGKDGTITAAVIDTLDQSYYDADELKADVESSVSAYNTTAGEDSITVDKFEISEEGDVSLFMDYASYEDYASFNNVDFYAGDITDGYNNGGYRFQITFHQVEKGQVQDGEISRQDIFAGANHSLVVFSEDMEVEVPGNILYVSSNVEVTGKKTARMAGSSTTAETETNTETETETETETSTEAASTAGEDDVQELTATVEEVTTDDDCDMSLGYIIYE
jgi:hypothetical protein